MKKVLERKGIEKQSQCWLSPGRAAMHGLWQTWAVRPSGVTRLPQPAGLYRCTAGRSPPPLWHHGGACRTMATVRPASPNSRAQQLLFGFSRHSGVDKVRCLGVPEAGYTHGSRPTQH